jgi:acyl-CoA reductase-like NAD-dependent aldehyde dehydrogenase
MPAISSSSAAAADRFVAAVGRHLVDGAWVEALEADPIEVRDPGTGELLCTVTGGGSADVDRAVTTARSAFEDGGWRDRSPADRAAMMFKIADLIDEHAEELAMLEVRDTGMPLPYAYSGHIPQSARAFRYYAGWADKIHGRTSEFGSGTGRMLGYTRLEPIGVAGLIVPWNAPLRMATRKIAVAMAAGCTCVLKPAEDTPLSALRLGELLQEAGVPAGVVNVVPGRGETVGAALTAHAGVDKVSFTGSTAVGREIIHAAAGNLKKLTLELGGKSPVLVLPDADVPDAAEAIAYGIFNNTGQVCSAGSRLLAHESVIDELVERVAAIGAALRFGYGTDPEVDLGPLISERQRQTVSGFVDRAVADGARLVSGGRTPERAGYFYEPTVLTAVSPEMEIARDEVFGPVLVALSWSEIEEGIALAKDSPYGLAGSVFTADGAKAHAIARRLPSGRVGINAHLVSDFSMPSGGFKESGWGRENGWDGLEAFLETKSVFTPLADL